MGSHERLGAWDLAAAVPAAWSEGHAWTATVELPLGAEIEYKFAVVDPRHAPTWEPRYNRALTVAPAAAALVGAWNGEFAPVPARWVQAGGLGLGLGRGAGCLASWRFL